MWFCNFLKIILINAQLFTPIHTKFTDKVKGIGVRGKVNASLEGGPQHCWEKQCNGVMVREIVIILSDENIASFIR